jgi:hypothetical protein
VVDATVHASQPREFCQIANDGTYVYFSSRFDIGGSGQSRCYDATQTVTVTGLLVNAGGTANILAGQNILLKPGTTVISGGYAHGFISTQCFWCSAYPNVNLPATTPDESDNQLIPEPMLVKQGGIPSGFTRILQPANSRSNYR